ncbi:xanthine dehydrogenase family protein subunit M [Halalkalibacterium halodurans]|uniref:xanthine dehydrogenase family protein subunit M n=1 Tax=Halalkalibacterium halodurans TaxID=86665 RepID=UPI002E1E2B3D|nr:xanthine dehydrogenase family protein subunit M [Halalkalibacterium halodurans]
MISFEFEYYKPASVIEATTLFQSLDQAGKDPMYVSGATELITLGRVNQLKSGAIIDLKGISECFELKMDGTNIILGAAQSLTKIRDAGLFPFLNKAIVEIADHTARNKITLGGNLCANIIYRETALPLLLTSSQVVIASRTGLKTRPFIEMFQGRLILEKGEFLVQVIVPQSELDVPFVSVKKRRQWDVGYPLLTTAAVKRNGQIHVAFSGLCAFPFRDQTMEQWLNDHQLSTEQRIEKAIEQVPAPIVNDVHGSSEYRTFVLKNTLTDVLNELEGEGHV